MRSFSKHVDSTPSTTSGSSEVVGPGVRAFLTSRRPLRSEHDQQHADPAVLGATSFGGAGRPMPTDLRRTMESRFGFDFSNVRIHKDVATTRRAEALLARAWTVGSHIYLGDTPSLDTPGGRRLLTHELAHVVQQGSFGLRGSATHASVAALEDEASRAAEIADGAGPIPIRLAAPRGRLTKLKDGVPTWKPSVDVIDEGETDVVRVAGIPVARFKPAGDEPIDRVGEPSVRWERLPAGQEKVRNGNSVSLRLIVTMTYRSRAISYEPISAGRSLVERTRIPSAILSVQLSIKNPPPRKKKETPWRETELGKFFLEQERQRQEKELEWLAKKVDRELGKMKVASQVGQMQVDPGERLRMWMVVGAVAMPVAQVVSIVLDFIPIAGQIKMLVEAISGRDWAGIGPKLSDKERAISVLLAVIPVAGGLLKGGKVAVKAIARIARVSGKSPSTVIRLLQRAHALRNRQKELRAGLKALQRARGGPSTVGKTVTDATRGRLFGTKTGRGDPTKAAGTGGTNKYGDYWYSTRGTQAQQDLAKYHEQVHSILSPKLNALRTFRADVGMKAYKKSHLMKYLEEALAESVAQLRVRGIKGLPDGIRFPVVNGYVEVRRLVVEGAIGTLVVGGYTYGVYAIATGEVQGKSGSADAEAERTGTGKGD